MRETHREMDRNRLRETERLRGRERERWRQGQRRKTSKDGKQPIFVREAVVGRGPGFKDVGSPLDPEEISVDTQPGTHGICWLLLLVPWGPRSSRLPEAEAAGRGGPWGKSRDLGPSETVGAGGSCFETQRKPTHRNKC